MRLIDEKFKKNKLRYAIQCSLASLSVFLVLLILDSISNAAVIASLGASSFIAFTMPKAQVSKPRYMIGGYVVGTVTGCLCHYLHLIIQSSMLEMPYNIPVITLSAISVGMAIFLMTITNTEHPPAAGIALGLVFDGFSFLSVLIIIVGIVCLSIIKIILTPNLENLL